MNETIEKYRPFEFLTHKDGKAFSRETINNWYVARAYVLERLENFTFAPNDCGHLHAVIVGDSPLMLSVLRQVALSAHYINYEEYDMFGVLTCKNHTVITLVSNKESIVDELKKEEYLCNLLDYCTYSLYGKKENEGSYIDIELQIVKALSECDTKDAILLKEEDVQKFPCMENKIDTRNAVLASRMYNLGEVIGNLPAEDIHCTNRYAQALGKFQHVQMQKKMTSLIDDEKWKDSLTTVKESLSNLFCADCFESRNKGIEKWWEEEQKKKEEEKDKKIRTIDDVWEKFNDALSRSEHERWVVEKLIMGYRPFNDQERSRYESLFGEERKAFRKKLKNNSSDPAHIDLCSYRDLRRINPDDLKYDSFLVLAIPAILNKTRNSK